MGDGNELFLNHGFSESLSNSVRRSVIWERQSRAASPPHRKEPSEAVTSWVRDGICRMAWEPLDVFPDKLEVGRGSSVLPCFACCVT